jgi:oligoendopeptidase F
MKRSEIDDKYKWNLKDIYASDKDWESDFKKLQDQLPASRS